VGRDDREEGHVNEVVETGRCNVPALGFGTWELEGREAYDAVRTALEVGYRHIDTAQVYGNEEAVGRALADSEVDRDDVFLTTKVWKDRARPDEVAASTKESLQRLGTDRVDLLLLHWPSDDVPVEQTLAAMTELIDEDKTRHVGVSNFPSQALDRAARLAPIVTDQVEHHPFLAVDAIRETADEHDLFVTAYSPLARGRVLDDDVLVGIGDAHERTAAQIVIAWLLQAGVSAIPRSRSPERIAQNFDVFDIELTADEVRRIDALDRGMRLIDPPFAPAWD
jgi:diketogulonate reductase-like aldo/keto reductase